MSARQVVGGVEDGSEQPREAPLVEAVLAVDLLPGAAAGRQARGLEQVLVAGRWSRSAADLVDEVCEPDRLLRRHPPARLAVVQVDGRATSRPPSTSACSSTRARGRGRPRCRCSPACRRGAARRVATSPSPAACQSMALAAGRRPWLGRPHAHAERPVGRHHVLARVAQLRRPRSAGTPCWPRAPAARARSRCRC